MEDSKDMPAWLICGDILVRIKNELILEAIDVLHNEIEEKRMQIAGSIIALPDRSEETEKETLVLNKLLREEANIRATYNEYIRQIENSSSLTPETIERIGELKKFLLSLAKILVVMKFAKLFEDWVKDVGNNMKITLPSELIYSTAMSDIERVEALGFIISNRASRKEKILSDEEFGVLSRAFDKCKADR